MSVNTPPSKPQPKEYTLLPQDTYEVVIDDITDKERTKYKSEEVETVYQFVFEVAEGEQAGQKVWMNVTPSLFPGTQGLDPSNLYSIFKAVYPNIEDLEMDTIGIDEVNALIGKKLRVTVTHKTDPEGNARHKISTFLPVK